MFVSRHAVEEALGKRRSGQRVAHQMWLRHHDITRVRSDLGELEGRLEGVRTRMRVDDQNQLRRDLQASVLKWFAEGRKLRRVRGRAPCARTDALRLTLAPSRRRRRGASC